MADIIAIVEPIEEFTVTSTTAVSDRTVEALEDVNLTNLTNGSVLVYQTSTSKWNATTLLDQQTMEAGEF
jgi:hypothetical protein